MAGLVGTEAQAKVAEKYIAKISPNSPLKGTGVQLVAVAEQNQVDWRLLLAIAAAETSGGTTGNAQAIHNPFGMGPGISYNSWADAYQAAAQNLKGNYFDKGLTSVSAIGAKWAPSGAANDPTGLNNNWTRNVSRWYSLFGGNPAKANGYVNTSGNIIGGLTSIPGDITGAAGDVASAATGGLGAIVDLLKLLLDPQLWLRIGAAVLGVIGMVAGGIVLFKDSGVAGKPLGILIIATGFAFVFGAVKNTGPINTLKAFVGA